MMSLWGRGMRLTSKWTHGSFAKRQLGTGLCLTKKLGYILVGLWRCSVKKYSLTLLIERDEDGRYMASVPALNGCYSQASSVEELMPRIKKLSSFT